MLALLGSPSLRGSSNSLGRGEGGGREWQGREGGGREGREARRPPATLVTPPQEETHRGKRFSVGDLEDKVKYCNVQDSTVQYLEN